jgi:RTX calcium-binding nonapeptide repeat (4 copies)
VRGRTIFFAVLAALSLLCGTAVAKKHHRVVHGSKHADHMKLGKANNRVFAAGGDDTVLGGAGRDRLRGGRGDDVLLGGAGGDRLRGGQDEDVLDGGDGDDVINARGDGGDPDEVVCGPGEDTVLLGRNDRVVVEAGASTDDPALGDEPETGDEPEMGEDPGEQGDDGDDQGEDDDGCEHVKQPGPKACDSHERGCDEGEQTCVATGGGCEEPGEDQCVATERGCDDPVEPEPEPDDPVEETAGSEKLF